MRVEIAGQTRRLPDENEALAGRIFMPQSSERRGTQMKFFRFAVATPATYGPRLMHWFVPADHMAAPETVKSRRSYLRDTLLPMLLSGEITPDPTT